MLTEKKESSAPETAPVEKKKSAAKKSAGTKKTAAKKSSVPKKATSADKKDVSEKEVPVVEKPVPAETVPESPRRSVAFIGSECYPFVKTGGLGDVMYACLLYTSPEQCAEYHNGKGNPQKRSAQLVNSVTVGEKCMKFIFHDEMHSYS